MRYTQKPFLEAVLITVLLLAVPKAAISHVGHGDEFQAEGGINRVEVKAETDSLLGIEVNPIESAADRSATVLIPVTALVDDAGQQLVFVQYGNFYEPVPVTTGATQGDLIEVTDGLSVGEQLVTQGSLSLYAESRKTQTAEAAPTAAVPATDTAHAQADAQGTPHSHDTAGNLAPPSEAVPAAGELAQASETAAPSKGFPWGLVVGVTSAAAVVTGAMTVLSSGRKKKSRYSDGTYSGKKGGY